MNYIYNNWGFCLYHSVITRTNEYHVGKTKPVCEAHFRLKFTVCNYFRVNGNVIFVLHLSKSKVSHLRLSK